jgi:hypothetical protein
MFYARYALRLKKELSIYCALVEVPAEAEKIELYNTFVRYEVRTLIQDR